MREAITNVVGMLVRLVGLLFGLLFVLLGILLTLGYDVSNDKDFGRKDGPFSIGLGLITLGIVAGFSWRKRAAKRRAAANKTYLQNVRDMLSERIAGSLDAVSESMERELLAELDGHLNRANISDPDRRKELLDAARRGFRVGHKAAIREQVARNLPTALRQLEIDETWKVGR